MTRARADASCFCLARGAPRRGGRETETRERKNGDCAVETDVGGWRRRGDGRGTAGEWGSGVRGGGRETETGWRLCFHTRPVNRVLHRLYRCGRVCCRVVVRHVCSSVPVAAALFKVWHSLSDHLALSLLGVCPFLCSTARS